MKNIKFDEIEAFISKLTPERKEVIKKIREAITENLPYGFEETYENDMLHFVVPHTLYASGYHCDPSQPLPFISLASQKNSITLYHMGLYVSNELVDWFIGEYPRHTKVKLDMGKNCIRFKKFDQVPFKLIGELCRKMTPQEWIQLYEKKLKR